MKTITSLKSQQRKEDRVSVFLDGLYAFGLHTSIAAGLKVGQQLSPEECARLQHQDAIHTAYERALRFLSFRPRSRSELEHYLASKGLSKEMIREITAKLENSGWLDDVAFSRFWVSDREDFKPRSRRALRIELHHKGVSDQVIEQALEGINEEESAYRAACERASRLAHLDHQTFRRRLGGFLQRRGFDYEIVKDTVERLWREFAGVSQNARCDDVDFGPSTEDQYIDTEEGKNG